MEITVTLEGVVLHHMVENEQKGISELAAKIERGIKDLLIQQKMEQNFSFQFEVISTPYTLNVDERAVHVTVLIDPPVSFAKEIKGVVCAKSREDLQVRVPLWNWWRDKTHKTVVLKCNP